MNSLSRDDSLTPPLCLFLPLVPGNLVFLYTRLNTQKYYFNPIPLSLSCSFSLFSSLLPFFTCTATRCSISCTQTRGSNINGSGIFPLDRGLIKLKICQFGKKYPTVYIDVGHYMRWPQEEREREGTRRESAGKRAKIRTCYLTTHLDNPARARVH